MSSLTLDGLAPGGLILPVAHAEPQVVIKRALETHPDIVLPSGFNLNGTVLIDLAVAAGYRGKVLFVDTGYHFSETLATRDSVAARYPELNVITLSANLPDDALYNRDTDRCCQVRKVEPLQRYLDEHGVTALFSARSRDQGATRSSLPVVDTRGKRTKYNPLAHLTRGELERYALERDLPVNPLYWEGFLSIGCAPCTRAVRSGEAPRAGRWAGQAKTECGLWTNGV